MAESGERRWMSLAGTILLVAGATFAVVRPAAGHATLHLFGAHAGAGQAGTITLRIPHGCGSGLSTDRIVTRFDASWLSVAPGDVDGWTATVVRRPRGVWVVTWTATGSGLANDESGDFPLTVTWPATAGDYATPTVQSCGGVTMKWTDRYRGAADGDRPSPAEYPSPFVRVLGALP